MKKLLFIFSFLILNSTVFASSVGGSIGGWQVVSNVASGIGSKITATKEVMVNGASKVVTGTANITPKFTDVGRFMGKVGAASVAVEAMNQLLNGVDYVMDPVNNSVTYKRSPDLAPDTVCLADGSNCPTAQFLYYSANRRNLGYFPEVGPAAIAFANSQYSEWFKNPTYNRHTVQGSTLFVYLDGTEKNAPVRDLLVYINVLPNPSYDSEASKPVTVPLSDIGQQVIDQAEKDIKAGNVTSPAVVLSRAVAQDMVQEAEADDVKARPIAQELEKNPEYPSDSDAEGEITKPEVIDPATGEVVKPAETSSIAMQFPKACEWFPQLCLFIDWMQKPHELDDPDLPTKEIEKKEIDEELIKISSSSCPAPIDVNIPLPVFNTTYTDSISVSEYCPKIEKLAPVLQLLAFVLAIMIIKDI